MLPKYKTDEEMRKRILTACEFGLGAMLND
jgi:hypothetical protein